MGGSRRYLAQPLADARPGLPRRRLSLDGECPFALFDHPDHRQFTDQHASEEVGLGVWRAVSAQTWHSGPRVRSALATARPASGHVGWFRSVKS